MRPNVAVRNASSVKSTNRMFDEAADPDALIAIALSDSLGKLPAGPAEQDEAFLKERLGVYREYMARPAVMGRDLIDAGLKPGNDFSEILAYAHKLHLSGVEKENALKQTLAYARKMRKRH